MKHTPKKLALAVALLAAGTAFAADDQPADNQAAFGPPPSSSSPSTSMDTPSANPPSTPATADESVRQAQQALKDKGQDPGAIDGVMGPKTRAALKQFQQGQGLTASGSLDAQTTGALSGSSASDSTSSRLPSAAAEMAAQSRSSSASSAPATEPTRK